MPVLGALSLSLSAFVIAFFSTLGLLESGIFDSLSTRSAFETGALRLSAFAAPASMTFAGPAVTPDRPRRIAASHPVESVLVLPLQRRQPVDPVLASDEPKPEPVAAPAHKSKAQKPTAVAARAPVRVKAAPKPGFDTSTRSALGGPPLPPRR